MTSPHRSPPRRAIVHASVAAALAVIATALTLLDPDRGMTLLDYVMSAVLFAGTGTLAVALAVGSQVRANARARSGSQLRLVAGSVARSMIAAALWLGIVVVVQLAVSDDGAPSDLVALWILLFLILQGFVGVTIAIQQLEAAHRAREHALTVEAAAGQARLAALRHQLDPHFLFNALNTIAALVREDASAAEDAIAQLSRLLRHSLATDDASGTVGDELAVIRALAALARARFEDDLRIHDSFDASDLALAAEPLPPFLIQPLVENAIAHGMRSATPPVEIAISIARCAGGIEIEVVNDGRLDARRDAASIGLGNLRARLELLYPERHVFTLEERGGRVHAWLRLVRAA